jgi:uncharacterized protein YdeI (YjbR/CyaY-like superfamily)
MTKSELNPKVDAFLSRQDSWQQAFTSLRAIVLDSGLDEELKWGVPCYSLDGQNVVLMHGFKEYCALLFFKGALLQDPRQILVQQTKNVQAARQIRFTSAAQVEKMKSTLKAYIKEAIAAEKSGLKVEFKQTGDFAMPEEFLQQLEESPALQEAFNALTPGRQRAYLLHFASAKQSKTRSARVEKCMPHILAGKGLDD